MAAVTKATAQAYITTNLADNGIGAITAEHVRTAHLNILDTLLWTEQRRARRVAVATSSSNLITFKDFDGNTEPFTTGSTIVILVRCYDASGNNIDYQVTAQDVDDFTIVVASAGYIDYVATQQTIV